MHYLWFYNNVIFLLQLKWGCIHTPVWEDLTVWPSGAWFRATNPLLGACLKSSPPKLNFSSAFWQTRQGKDQFVWCKSGTRQVHFLLLCLMWYLEHTGGKEGLILHMLRDLKSQTQVITLKMNREKGQETWATLPFYNQLQMSFITTIMRIVTTETAPFLEKEIWPLSRSR